MYLFPSFPFASSLSLLKLLFQSFSFLASLLELLFSSFKAYAKLKGRRNESPQPVGLILIGIHKSLNYQEPHTERHGEDQKVLNHELNHELCSRSWTLIWMPTGVAIDLIGLTYGNPQIWWPSIGSIWEAILHSNVLRRFYYKRWYLLDAEHFYWKTSMHLNIKKLFTIKRPYPKSF